MKRALAVSAVLLVASSAGAADKTLLLLASPASDLDPDALADAIRLQVLDLGIAVDVRPENEPGRPVPERLHDAVDAMDDAGAQMALFYDRAPGDPEAILYAAHRDGGEEAIVAVIRLPGDPGPTLYRSFALRVRDLVGDLGAIAVPPPPPRWAFGAGWVVDWLPRLDPVLHGPTAGILHLRGWLELQANVVLFLPRSVETATGTAGLTALDLQLGARIARPGRTVLGAGALASARILFASGELAAGGQGDLVRATPVLAAETFVRMPALFGVDLELALTLEALLVRERLTLAGVRALDTGVLGLGLALRGRK